MNWFVDNAGEVSPLEFPVPITDISLTSIYRLYRFLTEVEDILAQTPNDRERLLQICPLVVKLLNSSYWLQVAELEPDPDTGWAVETLYDDPSFPLTVQLVSWAPGMSSTIHNHGSWGLVAMLRGSEENCVWQRQPTTAFPDRIVASSTHVLTEGDIITFLPDAIHSVKALRNTSTLSFNLYGECRYDRRFEFDVLENMATPF